jgi:hypothetical protein
MQRILDYVISANLRILRLIRAFIQALAKAFVWLAVECSGYLLFMGLGLALVLLGASNHVASWLSLVLLVFLGVFILGVRYLPFKSEVSFANWIARTLSHQASQEWEEYQDWLHDILLDYRQLLNRNIPRWQVTLVTYWRLTRLCITVSAIKLKKLAIRATRRL